MKKIFLLLSYLYASICLLSKGCKGSAIFSSENGLWEISGSGPLKLGNSKVNGTFKLCDQNIIYWIYRRAVFRGTYINEQYATLINDGCILSFDVDCSFPKLYILDSCQNTLYLYSILSKERQILFEKLKSPNRFHVDKSHKLLYFVYEQYIEKCSLETLSCVRLTTPERLKPTALTISGENVFVSFNKDNTFYLQKFQRDLGAWENIIKGHGYIINMIADENNLFFVDSVSSTVNNLSLVPPTMNKPHEMKSVVDIQLSSTGRILKGFWYLFPLATLFTKFFQCKIYSYLS